MLTMPPSGHCYNTLRGVQIPLSSNLRQQRSNLTALQRLSPIVTALLLGSKISAATLGIALCSNSNKSSNCAFLGPAACIATSCRQYSSSSSNVDGGSRNSSNAAVHGLKAADPFGPPPPLPQRRVVVTGLGLVTPLAVGVRDSWTALIQGRTGVRSLQPEDLPEAHRQHMSQLPCRVVAAVPRQQADAAAAAAGVDPRRHSPFIAYAMIAAAEALADARWQPSTPEQQASTGVSIGAGMSCTSEISEAGALIAAAKLRRLSPYFVPRILINMAAGAVSMRHQLRGPNHAVSTACATGVHCLGDAYRMVQRGDAQVMVAGATESCIDGISLGGFSRLKALSTGFNDNPAQASRPFDTARDGFVMGEGAGVLVLEDREHAAARGAHMYAEVRGYGLSGDAHHITAPHPDGIGAALAMQQALQGSGLAPSDIAYINAHATSTPVGDEIEQAAIHRVFGADGVQSIHVSSTKGATGHLLGAAGAVEAAFTVLAVRERMAPATCNLEQPGPQLLPLLVRGQAAPLRGGPIAAMCNSFGFGGTNASIVFASVS